MQEDDHEHRAFTNFAVDNGLDMDIHPLHLLYLNENTQEFLAAFQAGYEAGKEFGLQAERDNKLSIKKLVDHWKTESEYLKNSDGQFDKGVRVGCLTCLGELKDIISGV